MATTWLEDLATLLAAQGFGTVGTDIFYGKLPDQQQYPGAVMSIDPAPGRVSRKTVDATPIVYKAYAGAGLRFRDKPNMFLPQWDRCVAVWKFLDAGFAFTIGTTYYDCFAPKGTPMKLGEDTTGRMIVGFDVEVQFNP